MDALRGTACGADITEPSAVHIKGQRQFLFFDTSTKAWRDFGEAQKPSKSSRKWLAQNGSVEIEVECGNSQPDMADVTKTMNAIFLAPNEPLADVLPDYWRVRGKGKHEPADQSVNTADGPQEPIAKVEKGVSPPHVVYDPDPEYSEAARMARFQGTTVLWLVVDTSGVPKDIHVQRAIGLGLDDQAVKSVQNWKFNPAMKNGDPIPVQINVEVNFRLY